MVATDELVAGCMDAITEQDPRRAVREVLEQALASRKLVDAFGSPTAGLNVLYHAPDLTVLNVVWPPLFSLYPHDHRMWAASCIYSGREDNTFYRPFAQEVGPGSSVHLPLDHLKAVDVAFDEREFLATRIADQSTVQSVNFDA